MESSHDSHRWRTDIRLRRALALCISFHSRRWIFAAAMVVLVLLKLAMVSGQLCSVVGDAALDDALYVERARWISAGDWLGPYTPYTLAKGPMYSMWIAALFRLHVPLFLGQHLLYALACWLVIRASRPLRLHPAAELIAFAVVLFNPMTWSADVLRVVRAGIYPSLTLLLIACAVGIYAHRDRSRSSLVMWSIAAGVTLAAFWLTREERIWLLPPLGLLFAATIFDLWRSGLPDRASRLLLASAWMLVAPLPVAAICQLNSNHYGVFAVVVFDRHEFRSAYGALSRVTPPQRIRYVPVSAETRRRIYRVSPAFRQLEPDLEGRRGRDWASHGADLKPENEIAGGWFFLALHDAVARAGYSLSGEHAMNYYRRLAREVNEACEQGKLACGPRRASLLPIWQDGDGPELASTVARALLFLARFDQFSVHVLPAQGSDEEIRLFEDMTRERAATPDMARQHLMRYRDSPPFTFAARRAIGNLYQAVIKWWAAAALAAWSWAAVRALRRRSVDFLFVLNTALVGACISRALLLSWAEISSFTAISSLYFSPAYPLMLLFCTLATADAFTGDSQRQGSR